MVVELVRTSMLEDTGFDHVVGLESHSPHLMKMNSRLRIDNPCNVEKRKVRVDCLHSRRSAFPRTLASSSLPFRYLSLCFPRPFAFLVLCYQSENFGYPVVALEPWSPAATQPPLVPLAHYRLQ